MKYKVPLSFDLLSIDTDFKDFWILRELLLAGYRPRVIVMEINTLVGSNYAITVPKNLNQTVWDFPYQPHMCLDVVLGTVLFIVKMSV